MVFLISLTWIVFWLDKNSAMDRINILFIGILSVVSHYLVILDKIPKISYFTIMGVYFSNQLPYGQRTYFSKGLIRTTKQPIYHTIIEDYITIENPNQRELGKART